LVIDIETIPCQNLPEECIPQFDESLVSLGNLKDPFKIRDKIEAARTAFSENVNKEMSVSPDLSQVCCLGYGYDHFTNVFDAQDEPDDYKIIVQAWSLISDAYREHIPIVTFNGLSFDIPVLLRRSMVLDISVAPGMVADLLARYDNHHHYDLMHMLAFRNPFSGRIYAHNLNYYLARFDIGGKTPGMDGGMVYPAWKSGRHDEIAEYCKNDVYMTAALFKRVVPWLIRPEKKKEK
jgi:3'-5' exonuclease